MKRNKKEKQIFDVLDKAVDVVAEQKLNAMKNGKEEDLIYWQGAYTILHYILTELEKLDAPKDKLVAIVKEDN